MFSQSQKDREFCIQELKKIELSKEVLFSRLANEEHELFMFYKNNIKATISIEKSEHEGLSNNRIIFLYLIPQSFFKVKPEKISFLKFVESEILTNNFLLKPFVKKGLNFAELGMEKSIIELNDGFMLFSTIPNIESEMVIKVIKLTENNYSISVDLSVTL